MAGETLISIVTPVFNEEENVEDLYNAVRKTMEPLSDCYAFELIYTDNHSTDSTFEKLVDLAKHDGRVRVMRFSRNFGYQRSIATGYAAARGACAVQLDSDLQDPPSLIPSFIEHWEKGAKVVYGVRKSRQEGRLITVLRKLFYRLINLLSEEQQPIDSGDFRLIDQRIIKELGKHSDSDPYLRGQIAAMGFKQVGIPYERTRRERGTSKFPFSTMISLAIDGMISQSILPLRFATFMGLIVSVVMLLAIVGYSVTKMIFGVSWPPGFATTTVLLLLSISLNALFLGIIGEYLARIYRIMTKSHDVIIESRINMD